MTKVKLHCIKFAVKAGKVELAVMLAMLANSEGGNMVYLPNVQSMMQEYGMSSHQVAGYLSALAQRGKYKPTSDPYWGELV